MDLDLLIQLFVLAEKVVTHCPSFSEPVHKKLANHLTVSLDYHIMHNISDITIRCAHYNVRGYPATPSTGGSQYGGYPIMHACSTLPFVLLIAGFNTNMNSSAIIPLA